MGFPEPAGGPSPGERGSPAALNARLRHPCLPSDSGLVLGLCSPGESPGRGGEGGGGGGGSRSRSCACESRNCASGGSESCAPCICIWCSRWCAQ